MGPRPPAVLVMAILNIVFGSLGVACSLISGAAVLLLYHVPARQGDYVRGLYDHLEKVIPGYTVITISRLFILLALAVLLVVAGVGLLRIKRWARWSSIAYGVSTVVTQLADLAYRFVYEIPVTQQWQREKSSSTTSIPDPSPILAPAALIGYSIALLIVMVLPSVSAAFAGRTVMKGSKTVAPAASP